MKTTNNLCVVVLAAGLALLGAITGCQRSELEIDGESHFLQACTSSCPGGLSCVCGVCTLPCDGVNSCKTLSKAATCSSSADLGICASAPVEQSCQVTCDTDAACGALGAGFACETGRCVRKSAVVGPDAGGVGAVGTEAGLPISSGRVDVLFMIDNSGSMMEEQQAIKAVMPTFLAALEKRIGPNLDLHAAVVSSDVGAGNVALAGNVACNRPGGDRGEFQVKSGCGLDPTTSRFVIHGEQGALRNYNGDLASVLGCLAEIGTSGCGFEHQLQSVRVALDALITPANAGFLRSDASLLIVLLTDEDDCSGTPESGLYASTSYEGQAASLRCSIEGHLCNGAKPNAQTFSTPLANCTINPNPVGLLSVNELVAGVRAAKPAGAIRVAVIAGQAVEGAATYGFELNAPVNALDQSPVCSSAQGSAVPALRLSAFASAFQGQVHSICNADLAAVMTQIAASL